MYVLNAMLYAAINFHTMLHIDTVHDIVFTLVSYQNYSLCNADNKTCTSTQPHRPHQSIVDFETITTIHSLSTNTMVHLPIV